MAVDDKPVVYVIDDDQAVRKSLRWLIESAELAVEDYGSAVEFLDRADECGCVVTDLRMPGLDGLDLQQALIERGNFLPVVMITGHGDIEMAVRAMKAGAYDFLEKPFDDELLLRVVQDAIQANRDRYGERAVHSANRRLLARLTPRERQVLDIIVTGHPNKRVAYDLGISEKTVEAHRARIMDKMEASSFADLVTKVITAGE